MEKRTGKRIISLLVVIMFIVSIMPKNVKAQINDNYSEWSPEQEKAVTYHGCRL